MIISIFSYIYDTATDICVLIVFQTGELAHQETNIPDKSKVEWMLNGHINIT